MMHERLVVTLLISGIINSACTNRIHEDKMSVITLDSISIGLETVKDSRASILSSNIIGSESEYILYYSDSNRISFLNNNDSTWSVELEYPETWPIRASVKIGVNNRIYVFSNESEELYVFTESGDLLRVIKLFGNEEQIVAQSFYDQDFKLLQNGFVINIEYTDMSLGSIESFQEYYSRPSLLYFPFLASESKRLFCYWPSNYRQGNFYGSFFRYTCVSEYAKSEVIVSFPANDTLFVFNNFILTNRICVKSNFSSGFYPIEIDKISDYNYLYKYQVEHFWYENLVYNPFKEEYYRIANHGVESYIKEDGRKISSATDVPYSIIVMDEEFHIKGEVKMDQTKFLPYRIAPTKEGIFISAAIDPSEKVLKYFLIDFKYESEE